MLWLTVMGVVVHLLMLSAVFDIYFVSPIQQGLKSHKAKGLAPAKRLVLFVADGLRADSLFGPNIKIQAPYLNSIVNHEGSWGISHTQVPTESRPGHIAILAGFNEDPSAVTRGWKSNPVDFDYVLNQSTNAWCWGSPDIVDIFNKDNVSRIHLYSYDAYMQDFSGKESPTILDKWVFDEVHKFFEVQGKGACTDVCVDGNIFFLHLLGLDTAGHSFKPGSEEHIQNIEVVDDGVRDIVNLFQEYFKDDRTAFIFTADHGMTNWGSHGDGSPHETNVPFIAWGAGIPKTSIQNDILQTDIAPLISSLIGINFPINSVGVIPLNYLAISVEQKANIIFTNALQLSEQYMEKHKNLKSTTLKWSFQPYLPLSDNLFSAKLKEIEDCFKHKRFQKAIISSHELIKLIKDGIKYYTYYYQDMLLTFVTAGFIGWIIFLCISITDLGTNIYRFCRTLVITQSTDFEHSLLPVLLCFLLACTTVVLYVQSLPFKYYIYCLFPILTVSAVVKTHKKGLMTLALLNTFSSKQLMIMAVTYGIGIELLTFSFFDRTYLTFIFFYLSSYSFFGELNHVSSRNWVLGLLILGFGPVVFDMQTTFNYYVHILTCALWIHFAYSTIKKISCYYDGIILKLQFTLLVAAFVNSLTVSVLLENGKGLLLCNQLISWILLIISPFFPLFMSFDLKNRIESIVISLMTPYSLMAVGFENLYMFFFVQLMLKWVIMEHQFKNPYRTRLPMMTPHLKYFAHTDRHSVRRCFYLLTFTMLSYFGVGNTASISSFDPMWVRCFVTVFSPFTMTGLIAIKLIVPFLVVMCVFQVVMIITKAQTRNTFLIILLFCDLMMIHFLYFVKNEGSWLEIGISLSRYIAGNFTAIVLLLLYKLANFLITGRPLFVYSIYKIFISEDD